MKFDELGKIPKIKQVLIDGVQACFLKPTDASEAMSENNSDAEENVQTNKFPENPKVTTKGSLKIPESNDITLKNLPFDWYPSITEIVPSENNNVNLKLCLSFST